MKEPMFNVKWYNANWNEPREGTQMAVYSISHMPQIKDTDRRRIQMADCGFRVATKTWKDEYWNQATYEDIDYKFWIEYYTDIEPCPEKIIDPIELREEIFIWIVKNCPEGLFYSELSRSGKAFHFIFAWDVPRTEEWRERCKKLSARIIKTAFIECGHEDIIEFKLSDNQGKVFDDCTDSKYQMCFLTMNQAWVNHKWTGEMRQYDFLVEIAEKETKHEHVSNNEDYIVDIEKLELSEGQKVEYIDHYGRWMLYRSLRAAYPDTYEEEWRYCCEHMAEADGHTVEWYKSRTEGSSWDRDFMDGGGYIDSELMKKFGYNVAFIRKTNKKGKTDFLDLI